MFNGKPWSFCLSPRFVILYANCYKNVSGLIKYKFIFRILLFIKNSGKNFTSKSKKVGQVPKMTIRTEFSFRIFIYVVSGLLDSFEEITDK